MILKSINEFGKTPQHAKAPHTNNQVKATKVCALAAITMHLGIRDPLMFSPTTLHRKFIRLESLW